MVQRIILTYILVEAYLVLPRYGYLSGGTAAGHLLYPLCHANIFHLAGNILCLWMLRCPIHISITYLIAVVCSFLPCMVTEPTMGFSGVLFAMAGISWGKVGRFRGMIRKCIPVVAVTAFIPHVNVAIHIYCMLVGYLFGLLRICDPLEVWEVSVWKTDGRQRKALLKTD